MKNHLGKITLLLLFPILLFASSPFASTTLSSNKKELVVKEAFVVTFTATQQDPMAHIDFIFEPQKSDNFKTSLLSIDTQKNASLNKTTLFKYLVFPLKSGDITLNFNFLAHIHTSETLTDIGIGDRDLKSSKVLVKNLQTQSLALHVNPLSKDVDLVGDFNLESKLQKNEINQYGAAKINYTLSGVGYVDDALKPLGEMQGITSFSQVNNQFLKATQEGYDLKKDYMYALSSKNNFAISPVELKAYSPKKKIYYTLKTPSYNIKVSSIDPATLIDKKEFPENSTFQLKDLKDAAIAALIFFAGFFTAKLAPKWSFIRKREDKFRDIKEAKEPKELIIVLMQNYPSALVQESIDALEALLYNKSENSFAEIKKSLLKNLM